MHRAVWAVVNGVQLLFVVVWTAGWISLALVAVLLGGRDVALLMARKLWAPGLLIIGRIRIEVRGAERLPSDGSWYLACNHQSILDIPVLFASIPAPVHFVAKKELARVPFLGWYMAATGMVFVDRKRRFRGPESLSRAAALLRDGRTVVSFPAGTRNREGAVGRFKTGGFSVPIEARVPVVPAAIDGTSRFLPPGTFRARPGTVRVAFGEPIPTEGLERNDRRGLARRAEEAVRRLHRELTES